MMDKTVVLTPDRIEISFPYSEGLVARVKQEVPVARWDRDTKCWWTSVSPATAKLTSAFARNHQFTLDGRVVDLADVSTSYTKADRTPLYEYQKQGVDFIHQAGGTCILSDAMGVGKTIQALYYVKEANFNRVLVVCPASVTYKWKDEAERWTDFDAEVIATGKQHLTVAPIQIMSYAIMTARARELAEITWDLIIYDECHAIKNTNAKRTKGAQMIPAKHKLFLSGTPMLNRPIELFPTLNMIDPMQYSNYWAFAKRYCGAFKHKMGFWVVDGQSNLEELKSKLSSIMLRRTKQEVLKELPELTRSVVRVDLDNKSEYKLAQKELQTWLKLHGKTNRVTALTKIGYLRQVAGRGKIAATIELAGEILASNPTGKLVVYAHYKDTVRALAEAFAEYGVDTIVGEDSQTKRKATVTSFQTKQVPRVLVISSAGGEGIDLYRADNIIFVELPWNPSSLEQAEARLHRIGQKNAVTSYILLGRNTIDECVWHLIQSKDDVIDELIGTDSIETRLLEALSI